MSQLQEWLDAIDMECFLDWEGLDYRLTPGRSGEQLNVKECPVCGGDKWKVYLNAETGVGNCFSGSCETKFSKYAFIKAHFPQLSKREFFDTLKKLAQSMGWRAKRVARDALLEASDIALPESVELPHQGKNLRYLTQRGIDGETAQYFHLRYSKNGVFRYKQNGFDRVQSYAERVIIPVLDLDGNLVSFQGRDITGIAEKKYLFPPGFASTGRYLYNGHNARRAKRMIACEGVFDVMATQIALNRDSGFRDRAVIGTFGKHLSIGQGDDQFGALLQLKREGLEEITFLWDGEAQALKDATIAALEIRKLGLTARVARLPEDKDPNEVDAHIVLAAIDQAVVVTPKSAALFLLSIH
jgi:DNA primase